MAEELIRASDSKLNFGDYTLEVKAKQSGFDFNGGVYKVKTCKEITKLERNELFVYESVPGTKVEEFDLGDTSVEFSVKGFTDTQITLEMEEEQEYEVIIDGNSTGTMKTNLGGKLSFSVDLSEAEKKVLIKKQS
ncbi:MAG: endosialidase [Lachnospiraceae bacterium]|nr:endosialidase [Lachnospiraceae bacterium]